MKENDKMIEKQQEADMKKEKKKPEKQKAQKKKRTFKKPSVGTLLVIALICLTAAASVRNLVSLAIEHNRLEDEHKVLLEKKETLQIELKNINSKEYIEEQARKQLRLVNPDEILFIFDDEKPADKKPADGE